MNADRFSWRSDRFLMGIVAALAIDLLLLCLTLIAGVGQAVILSNQSLALQSTPAAPVLEVALKPTKTQIVTLTPTPRPALRQLAEQRGMIVGVPVSPETLKIPEFSNLLLREFNTITPENAMKWDTIHPELDRYDFSQGDAIVEFARQHGLKVYAHTLAWGNQLPEWVMKGDYSRDQWIQILHDHIKTVVGHYKGSNNDHTVFAWDVVNEAVGLQGELWNNFWMQKIGPEYVPLAFQFAHEADPDALLFYNDNGGEGLNAKSQGIYNLVKGLIKAGIPINGVGLQMHTDTFVAPTEEELIANIKRLGDLGMQVHITEMDVRVQNIKKSDTERLQDQAEIYRRVVSACLKSPNCTGFFTWGLTDRFSWIPGLTGHPDAPLLFDKNYQPKPALDAILTLFNKN